MIQFLRKMPTITLKVDFSEIYTPKTFIYNYMNTEKATERHIPSL